MKLIGAKEDRALFAHLIQFGAIVLFVVVVTSAVLIKFTEGRALAQSKTKIPQQQVINQSAAFQTLQFDLTQAPNAGVPKNAFNLTDPPALPTLCTVWVYVDGKLLAEGKDYIVQQAENRVVLVNAVQDVMVQIRYLSKY